MKKLTDSYINQKKLIKLIVLTISENALIGISRNKNNTILR